MRSFKLIDESEVESSEPQVDTDGVVFDEDLEQQEEEDEDAVIFDEDTDEDEDKSDVDE